MLLLLVLPLPHLYAYWMRLMAFAERVREKKNTRKSVTITIDRTSLSLSSMYRTQIEYRYVQLISIKEWKKKNYLRKKMESNRLNITKHRSNFNRIPGDVSIEWKQIDVCIRLNCGTNKNLPQTHAWTLNCRASEIER